MTANCLTKKKEVSKLHGKDDTKSLTYELNITHFTVHDELYEIVG